MENWKAIKGYEGYYEVSDLGRVRSVDRIIQKEHKSGYIIDQLMTGKIRKLSKQNIGFLKLTLSKSGVHKQFLVHRLVAEAFIPKVEGKPDVDHIDFNKDNNLASNLCWTEDCENNKKLFDAGRTKNTFKSKGRIVDENGHVYASMLEAAKALNLNYHSVWSALNGLCSHAKNHTFRTVTS